MENIEHLQKAKTDIRYQNLFYAATTAFLATAIAARYTPLKGNKNALSLLAISTFSISSFTHSLDTLNSHTETMKKEQDKASQRELKDD